MDLAEDEWGFDDMDKGGCSAKEAGSAIRKVINSVNSHSEALKYVSIFKFIIILLIINYYYFYFLEFNGYC